MPQLDCPLNQNQQWTARLSQVYHKTIQKTTTRVCLRRLNSLQCTIPRIVYPSFRPSCPGQLCAHRWTPTIKISKTPASSQSLRGKEVSKESSWHSPTGRPCKTWWLMSPWYPARAGLGREQPKSTTKLCQKTVHPILLDSEGRTTSEHC